MILVQIIIKMGNGNTVIINYKLFLMTNISIIINNL